MEDLENYLINIQDAVLDLKAAVAKGDLLEVREHLKNLELELGSFLYSLEKLEDKAQRKSQVELAAQAILAAIEPPVKA